MWLRALVIVLLLANVLYFLWAVATASSGDAQAEPERLTQQVRPQVLRVGPP